MEDWNKGGKNHKKTLTMLLLFGIIFSETAPIMDYTLGVEVNVEQQESPEIKEDIESENAEATEPTIEVVVDESAEEIEDEIEDVPDEVLTEDEEIIETDNVDEQEDGIITEDKTDMTSEAKENVEVQEPVKRAMMTIASVPDTNYVLAKDSDFSGTTNGSFVYTGKDEYVEIPHTIKGVNVTSYANMFEGSRVKGVKSTNKNVTNMSFMFYNYGSETLDVSLLDTSGVTDMGYMFGASNASQTALISLLGLETFDTSKVTKMNNMFTLLKSETINIQNFNTSNVTTMFAMFRDTKAHKIDVNSFDTRKVVSMSQMFMNSSATTLEISNLDTTNVITMSNMFAHTKDSTLDLSNFNTSKVTDMNYMFYASYAKILDLSSFDTSQVTNMSAMFRSSSATSIDFSSFNTEKVTNMVQMFDGSRATTLDLRSFDTRNVSNMSSMFIRTSVSDILGLEEFNTEKVTTMANMFKDTTLTEINVGSFNTVNVKDMSNMFQNTHANKLDLRSFNTGNVTNMSAMFQDARATDIEISSFDTTSVKNMGYMFHGINVEELDLSNFNTSNVTNMGYMFQETNVKTIDTSGFNTTKVTSMRNMYDGSSVEQLDLSNFNTSNVTDMSNMFKDTEATYIDVSSFNTMRVLEMISMFQGSSAENLDLRSFDTYKVTDMNNMFNGAKAKDINISGFDTSMVTNMEGMFGNTEVSTIDISSFDMSSVNNIDDMFTGTKATDGLARSSGDADKANSSKGKPDYLIIRPKYVVAEDEDFSGTLNGYFKYIGKDAYIEIPHAIKEVNVNSYKGMFEGTSVKGVVSTNKNVTDMGNMFKGNTSEELEVSGINTTGVTNMSGMFQDTKTGDLDLRNFTTTKVTNMSSMFRNTRVNEIDLGSFDTSKVTNMENMFNGSSATKGYARIQEDANKLNSSSNKGDKLHFTVWGVQTSQDITSWTNKPVTIGVTAESELEGVNYITWVNEPSKNLVILKNLVSYTGYNTPFIYDAENYSLTTTVKSDNNLVFSSKRGLEIGDEYTQSGYMYVNGKPLTQSMVRGTKLDTSEPSITPIVVDDETGYFKQTQQYVGNSNFLMHAYGTFTLPEGSVVTLRKLKVEKGREATEWTLSPEDALSGNEPGKFTVYTNGTYIFRGIDNKGNSKEIAHTVTNIDTVNPTAELTKSTEGWTSQDVTLYINAKDELSGVKSITLPDGNVVNASTTEFIATENKEYTFTITDNAGNMETIKTKVSNIDKSIPKLKANVDNTTWTKDPVNIKVTSEESASGLNDIAMIDSPIGGRNLLRLDGIVRGEWVGLDGVIVSGASLNNATTGYIDVGGTEYITLTLMDTIKDYQAGLIGHIHAYDKDYKSLGRVISDVSKSNGWSTPKQETQELPKGTRYVRANLPYFVDGARYQIDVGTESTPWKPAPEDVTLVNNSKEYQVVSNGIYRFRATYKNGASSEVSVNVTNIDREAPTIKVEDNPTDWVEEDAILLKVNAQDTLSGVSSITLPNGEEIGSSTATYKVTKNGEYEFKVTDNVGNVTIHKETVRYLMIGYSFYIYDKEGNPVEGADFELLRDGEEYKQATSNTEGEVDFGKVPPEGKYTIRQTYAPGGVVIDPEDIETGDFTEPIEVVTYPRGSIFPSTGTLGELKLIIMGVVTTVIIAYITWKKKKVK